MQIKIRVITNAKITAIKPDGDTLKVYLPVIPEKGKANKALIKVLAEYYDVPKSAIAIIRGERSKNKTVRIEGIDGDAIQRLFNRSTQ